MHRRENKFNHQPGCDYQRVIGQRRNSKLSVRYEFNKMAAHAAFKAGLCPRISLKSRENLMQEQQKWEEDHVQSPQNQS